MWRVVLAGGLILALTACGGDSGDSGDSATSPPTQPSAAASTPSMAPIASASVPATSPAAATAQPAETPTEPAAAPTDTPAPTSPAAITPDDVIAAFVAAGLEADSPRPMMREDYGAAPYVGEGVRFLIPSLGEDSGGRVFQVADDAERTNLVAYYVNLGKQSALFYSHVFEHDDIVVQINGDLADDIAAQYETALMAVGS